MSALPCIRITSIPLGEAPEEIRNAWIGLVIPLLVEEGVAQPQQRQAHGQRHYEVLAIVAVTLLWNHNKVAAQWWLTNARHRLGNIWGFNTECCELTQAEFDGEAFDRAQDETLMWLARSSGQPGD